MNNLMPIGKVGYPAAFAATVTICVAVAKARGVEVPADVVMAINTLGAFLIGYMVPLK
jgi:fluoride ion exporter CrcB/FEX